MSAGRGQFRIAAVLAALTAFAVAPAALAAERTVFENENFEFSVSFPKTFSVCPALSGDNVHGYYAWFPKAVACREAPRDRSSAIAIYADFNATFRKAPYPTKNCVSHWPGIWDKYRLDALSFPHRKSRVCVAKQDDGRLLISVTASAGRQWENSLDALMPGREPVPSIFYDAYLIAFPDRIGTDIGRFRQFLASIDIHEPLSVDR